MKRIKLAAILAVASFGIGGAVVANQLAAPPANVMNDAPPGQPAHWVPLTDNNGCDNETQRECIGYRATPGTPVDIYEFGNKL